MATRHQDRATQGREKQQEVQLFALAFVAFEISIGKHRRYGGRGDDQTGVEEGICVHQQKGRDLSRDGGSGSPDGDESDSPAASAGSRLKAMPSMTTTAEAAISSSGSRANRSRVLISYLLTAAVVADAWCCRFCNAGWNVFSTG